MRTWICLTAFALTACTGLLKISSSEDAEDSRDDPYNTQPILTTEGDWSGSLVRDTVSNPVRFLIDAQGAAYGIVRNSAGNPQELFYLAVPNGLINATNTGEINGQGYYRYESGGVFTSAGSAQATSVSRAENSGTMGFTLRFATEALPSQAGAVSVDFDRNHETDASLGLLSGNYGNDANISQFSLSIDANGTISGGSPGCSFSGSATVPNGDKNLYALSGTFTGTCALAGSATGIATRTESSSGGSTQLLVVLRVGARALLFSGSKQ